MTEIVRTPITLESLNRESAMFTGSGEETHEHPTLVGTVEVKQHYPMVVLQRDVWDGLGRPTSLTLVLES